MRKLNRRTLKTRLLAPAVPAVVAAAGLAAQQGEAPPRFSSRIQFVEIYATVASAKGEPATGLRREDFEVYENDRLQRASTFAAGELPLTMALGVDRSWSIWPAIRSGWRHGRPRRFSADSGQTIARWWSPSTALRR